MGITGYEMWFLPLRKFHTHFGWNILKQEAAYISPPDGLEHFVVPPPIQKGIKWCDMMTQSQNFGTRRDIRC
jgi:hypothetical protein